MELCENDIRSFDANDRRTARGRFSHVGLSCFVYVAVASLLQLGLAYVIGAGFPVLAESDYFLSIITIVPQFMVALPICWLVMRSDRGITLPQSDMGIGRLLKLFLIAMGLMYFGNLIGTLLMSLVGTLRGREVVNTVEVLTQRSNPWLNAATVVVFAPLVEEFIFRKLLIDRLARYGELAAVLASAVLFGLVHGNFYQFFYAFGLGAVFGYVYVKTGRMRYPVILHAAINLFGGVISPLLLSRIDLNAMNALAQGGLDAIADVSPEMVEMAGAALAFSLYTYALIGAAIAGIVLLIVNRKRISFAPGEVAIPRGQRFKVMYLNLGMLLFLLSCAALFVLSQIV